MTQLGHRVGPTTVRKLLRRLGYSLQGNAKTRSARASHPNRDAQFGYINDQVTDHMATGRPVISVDTKKKELVGNYRNSGRDWAPVGQPIRVDDHDFPGPLGKAIPYGIYDLAANTGWVSVGTDHDTPAFAANTILTWWQQIGSPRYPNATRLLICADSGFCDYAQNDGWVGLVP